MIDPVEHALWKISTLLDDLSSLVHKPGCAEIISAHDWPAMVRKIVDLQGDANELIQSRKVAAE